MKTIHFYKNNKSNNILHIETEGCIVNIRVGLTNINPNDTTHVEILPNEGNVFNGSINNTIITK
jgi:hypothetical protein